MAQAATKKTRISTKFFVGFELTTELRIHLSHSHDWKQVSVARDHASNPLIECPFQEKAYIGRYCDMPIMPLSHLKRFAKEISNMLQQYCPELDINVQSCHFFPLVLVA